MHKLLTGALSVEKLTLKIRDLPTALEGIKLVQMSDFHYDGIRLSEEMLAEAIAASNSADPDLVLLTGDYITHDPAPVYQLARHLKQLKSRAGVYAVLGNHDLHFPTAATEITRAFTKIEIRVLWNDIVYPFPADFAIAGLPEMWSHQFQPAKVMNQLHPHTPRIVLAHQPDTAQFLTRWRVDLQLSGHTHGGQIVVPKLGPVAAWQDALLNIIPPFLKNWIPFLNPECRKVVHNWDWSQGLHQVGTNYLYVNRGLGTYFPGRLFCPPEVTIITLVQS